METALVVLEELTVQCNPILHDHYLWFILWHPLLEKRKVNVSLHYISIFNYLRTIESRNRIQSKYHNDYFCIIFINRNKQQDLMNLLGATYSAVLFLGATNASSVQTVVGVERTVFYRERAAGMYSELPYAFAQVNKTKKIILLNLSTPVNTFSSLRGEDH